MIMFDKLSSNIGWLEHVMIIAHFGHCNRRNDISIIEITIFQKWMKIGPQYIHLFESFTVLQEQNQSIPLNTDISMLNLRSLSSVLIIMVELNNELDNLT